MEACATAHDWARELARLGHTVRRVQAQHRGSEASRRLETIPRIGVIGATAIAAGRQESRPRLDLPL